MINACDIISKLRVDATKRTLITEQCKTLKIQKRFSFKRSSKRATLKTVKRERTANVVLDQRSKLKHESLILAQDERWRRA